MGILEGDTFEEMADKMDYVALTLGYPARWNQRLTHDFMQVEDYTFINPERNGFEEIGSYDHRTNGDVTRVKGHVKEKGKAKVYTVT